MEISKESLLWGSRYDYVDCFEYVFSDAEDRIGIIQVAEAFSGQSPEWIEALLALRNRIAGLFGLKHKQEQGQAKPSGRFEVGEQAKVFWVFAKSDDEIVLGEDDKHLDFRVSLRIQRRGSGIKAVVATTAVKINNRLGRCYFFVVKPFHRIIVPTVMKRNFRRMEQSSL